MLAAPPTKARVLVVPPLAGILVNVLERVREITAFGMYCFEVILFSRIQTHLAPNP